MDTLVESQPNKVGCLNKECCDALVTNAMSKFQYLGIVSGAFVILCLISFFGSIQMQKKIKPYLITLSHGFDYFVLFIMILISGLMIYIIINDTPSTPGKPAHLKPLLKTNAKIKKWMLPSEHHCINVHLEDIPCDHCLLEKDYSLQLSTTTADGYLVMDKDFEQLYEQLHLGYPSDIDAHVQYCSLCPFNQQDL